MKKSIILKVAIGLLGLASLLSFTRSFGGDRVRVYLDSQMVFEQFLYADKQVHTVSLHEGDRSKKLEVQFSHCGVSGKERSLSLREGTRELKKWTFPNASPSNTSMQVPVKELWEAAQKEKSEVRLVYTSKEIPDGQVIASLQLARTAIAVK
jgi:hypothetical protein